MKEMILILSIIQGSLLMSVIACWKLDPVIDHLTVTAGNPRTGNTWLYNSLPVTEDGAINKGWVKVGDCEDSDNYRGNRYILNGDLDLAILYDVRGNVAGVQTSFPTDIATETGYPDDFPSFVKDGDRSIATAYFMPPDQICDWSKFPSQLTLMWQNTQNPDDSFMVPTRAGAEAHHYMTQGGCIPTMGLHYWPFANWDINTTEPCHGEGGPFFAMYKEAGDASGFGFAYMFTNVTSKRWERPAKTRFGPLFKEFPQCINDVSPYDHVAGMHFFFDSKKDIFAIRCPAVKRGY